MRELSLLMAMLLAVYGAAELLWRLACRLLCPHENDGWLLLLRGDGEDTEYRIRAARMRGAEPVVLDGGLTPEGAALAREVCGRLGIAFLPEKEWRKFAEIALQDQKRGV